MRLLQVANDWYLVQVPLTKGSWCWHFTFSSGEWD